MKDLFFSVRKTALAFFASAIMSAMIIAQTASPLEQMTVINRSGKWEQVAQLAEDFLNEKQSKDGEEKC